MNILSFTALLAIAADQVSWTHHDGHGVGVQAEPAISTVPADGAMLQRSPDRFEITFPYAVVLDEVVVSSKGRPPVVSEGPRAAWPSASALLPPLDSGGYVAAWRVHDAAGNSFTGTVAFVIR